MRITRPMVDVMVVLSRGDAHGYRIMREIETFADGKVGPGTLYGSIKRMLDEGLIEESARRPVPEADDERRRYYSLTDDGRSVLEVELTRMERTIAAASRSSLPAAENPV